MSIDVLLAGVSVILLFPALVGTVLLVSAAIGRPRIGALTDRAVIAVDICVMILSGVTITVNRLNGYSLFPIEAARVLFLLSLVLLEVVPVYWLWLWHTHRLGAKPLPAGTRLVLMSEPLFLELGASRVDWGEPDADGWYTPTLYRSDPA